MLLVKAFIYAGYVTLSANVPSVIPLPEPFQKVREVRKYTVGERFQSRNDCMTKIRFFLGEIPQEHIDNFDIRIESDECKEIAVFHHVPVPLPRQRPSI